MKPEEISPITDPSGNFNRMHEPPARPAETTKDRFKTQRRTDKVKPPQLDHIQINKLEVINSDSSEIAKDIRKVNQSMETIDSHLQKMQTALESIIKIYPPYPPGSSERIEALRQFNAFRIMIDQIAHPKRGGGMQRILGDPNRNPGSGDVRLNTGHDQADLVIRHQPAHTGPGGLDLPEMNAGSPDRHITAAIEKTSSAQQSLNLKRRNFIADANRIIARIT